MDHLGIDDLVLSSLTTTSTSTGSVSSIATVSMPTSSIVSVTTATTTTGGVIDPATARRQSIQTCLESLVHACHCTVTPGNQCPLVTCQKMKRLIQHSLQCRRKQMQTSTSTGPMGPGLTSTGPLGPSPGCPICKQLIALCCYHAKTCTQLKCRVPYCCAIRLKLQRQQQTQRIQQIQLMRRRMALMQRAAMFETTTTSTCPQITSPSPPVRYNNTTMMMAAPNTTTVGLGKGLNIAVGPGKGPNSSVEQGKGPNNAVRQGKGSSPAMRSTGKSEMIYSAGGPMMTGVGLGKGDKMMYNSAAPGDKMIAYQQQRQQPMLMMRERVMAPPGTYTGVVGPSGTYLGTPASSSTYGGVKGSPGTCVRMAGSMSTQGMTYNGPPVHNTSAGLLQQVLMLFHLFLVAHPH